MIEQVVEEGEDIDVLFGLLVFLFFTILNYRYTNKTQPSSIPDIEPQTVLVSTTPAVRPKLRLRLKEKYRQKSI